MNRKEEHSDRSDIYSRITNRIVADLEKGVRPWMKPWSSANAAGRVTRPLRHNGQPYSGMNVLLLWSEGIARGFSSQTWMTFKQALQLDAAVRKGEAGSTVVFASRFTKSEDDGKGGEVDREIPFLKAYRVFNVEQIDGLPSIITTARSRRSTPSSASNRLTGSFATPVPLSGMAATRPIIRRSWTTSRCHPSRRSRMRPATMQP